MRETMSNQPSSSVQDSIGVDSTAPSQLKMVGTVSRETQCFPIPIGIDSGVICPWIYLGVPH